MKRLWEIDSLRGIAISMMILSNLITDLLFFGLYEPGILSIFWTLFAYATATIFIFLVGVSLTLSYSHVKKWSEGKIWKKYIKRGSMIFSWGLLITLVTYMLMESGYILFGVLHLIGISIILAVPFLKYRELNLWLGMILILTGTLLKGMVFDFNWLLWLGLVPANFSSIDFFPVLPWFGVVLIGIYFGNIFYPDGKRILPIKERTGSLAELLSYLGRKSLLIYLIHQPILIGLLYFLFL